MVVSLFTDSAGIAPGILATMQEPPLSKWGKTSDKLARLAEELVARGLSEEELRAHPSFTELSKKHQELALSYVQVEQRHPGKGYLWKV